MQMCNVISDKRVISLVLPCYLIKKKNILLHLQDMEECEGK